MSDDPTEPFELAMFPLGTVLLPGELLPLHVFEPRYRAMIADCLSSSTEPRFGVVLIERGHEVGGGDQRLDIGVAAAILRVGETPQGTLAVLAVGVRRVRVDQWLDDDPYPRAMVTWWDDELADPPPADEAEALAGRLRMVRGTAMELGDLQASHAAELSEDPARWAEEIPALVPVGPLDRYRLLVAPTLAGRFDLVGELLGELEEIHRLRLDPPAQR